MEDLETVSNAELQRNFSQFLRTEGADGEYAEKIKDMVAKKETRLIVSIDDIRNWNAEIATRLLNEPFNVLPIFEKALDDALLDESPTFFSDVYGYGSAGQSAGQAGRARGHIGFEGNFGSHGVTPRTLISRLLCRLVCVEGIVTKASLVRPKVMRSVHYCPATKAFIAREYRDATDFEGLPTGSVYPTRDDEGNALETEFGLCSYKDHQSLTIQEMPERAPLGQLPRSVDVILDDDLVDRVKPGDRVQIVGVYRALANVRASATSGLFRTVILGNNVSVIGKDVQGIVMTGDDIKAIRREGNRKSVFETMSRSLAPSIYGHKYIKQALLLLLLGGREKNLANGTHIRGDINILMVGDPSTAKSQLLRFVLGIAPLAVNTTGRGSSGVGLTAAVTTDKETGERRLEAGAMVLADRGVVCIDEFDKMSDMDRVAIHEVMEQQTVTIAKAGIQASLNARCSVVAAANPIYGRYDRDQTPQRNVNLPDSLLSRFDLLFIVLDSTDKAKDKSIAQHVLQMHRYQRPGHEGIPVPLDAPGVQEELAEEKEESNTSPVFEKFNPLLHGGAMEEALESRRGRGRKQRPRVELYSHAFLRKYIHYAKNRVKPQLTDDARELIASYFNTIRQKSQDQRAMPVTARMLETLIRLSTAHAKCRLSKEVTEDDVNAAYEIMTYALHAEAAGAQVVDDEDDEEFDSDDETDRSSRPSTSRSRSSLRSTPSRAPRTPRKSQTPSRKTQTPSRSAQTRTPPSRQSRASEAADSPDTETPGRRSKRISAGRVAGEDTSDDLDVTTPPRSTPRKRQRVSSAGEAEDGEALESKEADQAEAGADGEGADTQDSAATLPDDIVEMESVEYPAELLNVIKRVLIQRFRSGEEAIPFSEVESEANAEDTQYTRPQLLSVLKTLQEDNRIMYVDGFVYRVN